MVGVADAAGDAPADAEAEEDAADPERVIWPFMLGAWIVHR